MHIDSADAILKRYLDDIRKTVPLTPEEEKHLFDNRNNPVARRKLVDANMRFVLKVAIQYRGCPVPLPDLVSEGAMGLMRAIESFDNTRGVKFISYGVWWIKAYITKAINEQGTLVRLPANKHLELRRALKSQARGLDIEDDVQELIMGQKGFSLDCPLKPDSKASYGDTLEDQMAIDPQINIEVQAAEREIRGVIKTLPRREQLVIAGIYGIGIETAQTLREVGESMNISHERVRQLRDQAIRRIEKNMSKESLKENLEALSKSKRISKH